MNTNETNEQKTPRGNRLHIGIFGRTNSGKSSVLNSITKQACSIVSPVSGTTTDPVYKPMELHGIGPVVFIDTAGFNDETILGKNRLEKTELAFKQSDIVLLIFSPEGYTKDKFSEEKQWLQKIKKENKSFIPIFNKTDLLEKFSEQEEIKNEFFESIKTISSEQEVLWINCELKNKTADLKENGVNKFSDAEKIRRAIERILPEEYNSQSLTGNLCKENSLVLLVMPQDIQAPKGRLILPQVQIIRDLLDKKCIVVSCTTDKFETTLQQLKKAPELIITDSQVFKFVFEQKPKESLLTSFSVLLAASKGNIENFVSGAKAISRLTENSKILIAEACTHAPLTEDIGREKIPRMLSNFVAKKENKNTVHLAIDFVSGANFPNDLSQYSLIIHCGACMFNRAYVLSRQEEAKQQKIPMTNYGITIAFLTGILNEIALP